MPDSKGGALDPHPWRLPAESRRYSVILRSPAPKNLVLLTDSSVVPLGKLPQNDRVRLDKPKVPSTTAHPELVEGRDNEWHCRATVVVILQRAL